MDVIERFEAEFQEYHRISKNRRQEQVKVLRQLEDYLSPKPVESLDPDDLRGFLALRKLHPNTIRKIHGQVKSFIRWCFTVELIDGERFMRLQTVEDPKGATSQQTPKPYSIKELREFRRELDETWPLVSDRWWHNYRMGRSRYRRIATEVQRRQVEAIVALALQCGLRQQEIFNLSLDDMHPDNAYVVVRQRSDTPNEKDRFREVPYTESARAIVRRWLELRAEIGTSHDRPWIKARHVKNSGESWLEPMPWGTFKGLLRQVGGRHRIRGKECWRLHRLRHTSATSWLRAGMDLELVSEHLGHKNLSQTLAYAELVREDIQRAVERNEGKFERLIGEEAA